MKSCIQRVNKASVWINNQCVTQIKNGLLVYLCIEKGDQEKIITHFAKKILKLRIFQNEKKQYVSLKDIKGECLIISQFTLCATIAKGNRPDFSAAEEASKAKKGYELFISTCKENYEKEKIKTGVFGENMNVHAINDGPFTLIPS